MATLEQDVTDPQLSVEEQERLNKFIADNQMFYGPDPEIMGNHRMAPRSEDEERILSDPPDPHVLNRLRGRLDSALQEGFDMCEQMGAAPGAKWGDLTVSILTAAGDLSGMGPKGIVTFATVLMPPVKFILKYWKDEPTVGIRDGDGFIHNDARFGNIHNTDQSTIMPFFHEGKLLCWICATIHEGENGSCEPGGMPAAAESKFDEGLKMCPFRIIENNTIKKDIVNFLQNSVRDPKLQLEDIKVKLHAALRVRQRIESIIDEFGPDAFVAVLRANLEDTAAEVRRRIEEMPEGTVRTVAFIDSTLRENVLLKFNLAVTVKGDRMILDIRGTAGEFTNRSINTNLASFKTSLATCFLNFVWPDLPHNQAVFEPMELVAHKNSVAHASDDAPNAMSLIPIFRAFTLPSMVLAKMLYSLPQRATNIIAPHYSQPACFIYGGMTQNGEMIGNFCADINGNGQGARSNLDGEPALSPVFGYFCDTGEQEIIEEELPMIRLIAQKVTTDRVGLGKHRGGCGYEQMVTCNDTNFWGLMTGCTGSLHPSTIGLFGGYGGPTYPLLKIKNTNVIELFKERPQDFRFSMLELWNEQPIPGDYGSYDMGMTFEPMQRGEVYAMCQGTGGGYGDVLERDPAAVMKDIEEMYISAETARDIYKVVFREDNLVVDEEATEKLRAEERQARIQRGVPFDRFVEEWVLDAPPEYLPYYGSWDDDEMIYAGAGKDRKLVKGAEMTGTVMPDPRLVKIAELEKENKRLRTELESRATGA